MEANNTRKLNSCEKGCYSTHSYQGFRTTLLSAFTFTYFFCYTSFLSLSLSLILYIYIHTVLFSTFSYILNHFLISWEKFNINCPIKELYFVLVEFFVRSVFSLLSSSVFTFRLVPRCYLCIYFLSIVHLCVSLCYRVFCVLILFCDYVISWDIYFLCLFQD